MKKSTFFTKASIYFTFFADNLGWSIVFPIFAPLFLDTENTIFSPEISVQMRTNLLGFFLMAFPLAQFFGSPILGDYADKAGRRKALLISVFFTFIGVVLSAWSIHANNLTILFISRLITGAFAGNLSICLASIADISESDHHKVKNFGYLAVVAGLSFIIGAYIGGKFSDANIHKYFNFALPLWIAAFFSFANFFFIWFGFYETKKIDQGKNFRLFEGVRNIKNALQIKKIKSLYLVYFLLMFAWLLVFQFTPVYLIQTFRFSNSKIGDVAAYLGFCWGIGSILASKVCIKFFSKVRIFKFSLIAFTLLCLALIFTRTTLQFLPLLGVSVIFAGISWPVCTGIISNRAGVENQGKILGMSQSMQSLAMAVSPLVGGFSDYFHHKLFFAIAAFACFVASSIFFKTKL